MYAEAGVCAPWPLSNNSTMQALPNTNASRIALPYTHTHKHTQILLPLNTAVLVIDCGICWVSAGSDTKADLATATDILFCTSYCRNYEFCSKKVILEVLVCICPFLYQIYCIWNCIFLFTPESILVEFAWWRSLMGWTQAPQCPHHVSKQAAAAYEWRYSTPGFPWDKASLHTTSGRMTRMHQQLY